VDRLTLKKAVLLGNGLGIVDKSRTVGVAAGRLFFVRGSYQMAPTAETDVYQFGPAFGAGMHYNASGVDLTLDYAYRTNNLFDASNVVTLKVGF
jgi:hypothetical protein